MVPEVFGRALLKTDLLTDKTSLNTGGAVLNFFEQLSMPSRRRLVSYVCLGFKLTSP